jgi:hypothetical protein
MFNSNMAAEVRGSESRTRPSEDQLKWRKQGHLNSASGIPEMSARQKAAVLQTAHEWVLDSGATDHMSPHRDKFQKFRAHRSNISVGGGIQLSSEGTGEIVIDLVNSKSKITLHNVLYVPRLDANLMSTPKITDKGHEVRMRKDYAIIVSKKGKVLAHSQKVEDTYILKEVREQNFGKTARPASSASATLEVWHNRLGHLNKKDLQKLLEDAHIRVKMEQEAPSKVCEACVLGKIKRKPFPKASQSRMPQRLKLIHTDVGGPIHPTSRGGNKYFITFIDDYSRKAEVHLLKSKDEALSAFKKFKKRAENHTGEKVAFHRSDNGGEFLSGEFENFLT